MPRYAVTVDRAVYRLRHSPWGLPSANLEPTGLAWGGAPDVVLLCADRWQPLS